MSNLDQTQLPLAITIPDEEAQQDDVPQSQVISSDDDVPQSQVIPSDDDDVPQSQVISSDDDVPQSQVISSDDDDVPQSQVEEEETIKGYPDWVMEDKPQPVVSRKRKTKRNVVCRVSEPSSPLQVEEVVPRKVYTAEEIAQLELDMKESDRKMDFLRRQSIFHAMDDVPVNKKLTPAEILGRQEYKEAYKKFQLSSWEYQKASGKTWDDLQKEEKAKRIAEIELQNRKRWFGEEEEEEEDVPKTQDIASDVKDVPQIQVIPSDIEDVHESQDSSTFVNKEFPGWCGPAYPKGDSQVTWGTYVPPPEEPEEENEETQVPEPIEEPKPIPIRKKLIAPKGEDLKRCYTQWDACAVWAELNPDEYPERRAFQPDPPPSKPRPKAVRKEYSAEEIAGLERDAKKANDTLEFMIKNVHYFVREQQHVDEELTSQQKFEREKYEKAKDKFEECRKAYEKASGKTWAQFKEEEREKEVLRLKELREKREDEEIARRKREQEQGSSTPVTIPHRRKFPRVQYKQT